MRRLSGAAVVTAVLLLVGGGPAAASAAVDPGDPAASGNCAYNTDGVLTSSVSLVEVGNPVNLQWSVTFPAGINCQNAEVRLNNLGVSPSGSKLVRPTTSTTYQLMVAHNGYGKYLGRVTVNTYRPQTDILSRLTGDGQMRVSTVRCGMILKDDHPVPQAAPGQQVLGTGDFNRDNVDDILWLTPASGEVSVWIMQSGVVLEVQSRGTVAGGRRFLGIGDFFGTGHSDILWLDTLGVLKAWFNGTGPEQSIGPVPSKTSLPDPQLQVVGTGDFNSDGRSDILWRHTGTGQVGYWLMNGAQRIGQAFPAGATVGAEWTVEGIADFDADAHDDILWRHHPTGALRIWFRGSHLTVADPTYYNQAGAHATLDWKVRASDFNNDGTADLLWRRDDGALSIWHMNGAQFLYDVAPGTIDQRWEISGLLHS